MSARAKKSFLGEAILLDWSDGIVNAVGLVRYSRYAKRDGLNLEMIDKFANCGGSNYENAAKHLKEVLRAAGSEEMVTHISDNVYKYGILPSDIIKLIARSPDQFKLRLAPSTDEIELFWQDFFSSESGMQYKRVHPHLKNATAQSLKSKLAIRIHQDAGPFTKSLSVDVISWSSMHGTGTELETK